MSLEHKNKHKTITHSEILTLTLAYLSQITEKMQRYDSGFLRKLDSLVLQYIDKRNELSKPILDQLSENAETVEDIDFDNLVLSHNLTQKMLLELNEEESQYQRMKEKISDNNFQPLKEITTGETSFNQIGFMLTLCKDLILKLSKYQEISGIVESLQNYRSNEGTLDRDHAILEEVEKYIGEVDHIFRRDASQEQNQENKSDIHLDFTKNSQSGLNWLKTLSHSKAYIYGGETESESQFNILLNLIE